MSEIKFDCAGFEIRNFHAICNRQHVEIFDYPEICNECQYYFPRNRVQWFEHEVPEEEVFRLNDKRKRHGLKI